jgi:mono/diheme cytochrome c family protein
VLAQVFILSGTMSAQQAPSPTPLTPAETSGRGIFQTRCAMCHVGQEPATEMANESARRPATLGPLLSKANASDETRLRRTIKDGSRLMPGYRHALTDEQIDQVIAFMKTIERPLTRIFVPRAGE